jgi:hypothetical protein
VLWGAISLVLYLTGATMSLASRAVVTATTAPLVVAAIWASGGANSFLGPLLLFTSLFIAYFFPPRLAWPLVALFAGVYATPLLYDPSRSRPPTPRVRWPSRSPSPASRS